MQLVYEIAIGAWSMVSVGLAIWTYSDAWLLAFSRGWSAVSLVGGPVGLLAYLVRSRLFGMEKPHGQLPEYEMRHVTDETVDEPTAPKAVARREKRSVQSTGPSAVSSEFEPTNISQGLPRCPRCSTAVSYYDVKCMRCGQLLKPAAAGSSF